jgi:hypothetical protein
MKKNALARNGETESTLDRLRLCQRALYIEKHEATQILERIDALEQTAAELLRALHDTSNLRAAKTGASA